MSVNRNAYLLTEQSPLDCRPFVVYLDQPMAVDGSPIEWADGSQVQPRKSLRLNVL